MTDSGFKFVWTFNPRTNTSVFGNELHGGGGVYEENDIVFFGNSVVSGKDIVNMGPFQSISEAKLAIEADFIKRSSEE